MSRILPETFAEGNTTGGIPASKTLHECFKDTEVNETVNEVDRCFLNLTEKKINPGSDTGACNEFKNLEDKYIKLNTTLINHCPHYGVANPNETRHSVLEVLEFVFKDDHLLEFTQNQGFDCIKKISSNIESCHNTSISIKPTQNDTTKITFWERTYRLSFNVFTCATHKKFKKCVNKGLHGCSNKSIDFIGSVLNIFDRVCINLKNITKITPEELHDNSEQIAMYSIFGIIGIVLIAGVTFFVIKKTGVQKEATELISM